MRITVIVAALYVALGAATLHASPDNGPRPPQEVGEQPSLPEDGCVYAGLGYSDRIFVTVPAGVYQCRAQHWYAVADLPAGVGMSPADFASLRAQAPIAGDGCIYAGLGFSDGAVLQTAVGRFLCKSHHWDRP